MSEEAGMIEKYIEPINYLHRCPCCGSVDVVRNGTYERNILFLSEGRLKGKRIHMQRFLCKACRKTRSHYPKFMIPHKIYSLGLLFIVVLSSYGIRRLHADSAIPVSSIRSIRKKYKTEKKRSATILSMEMGKSYERFVETYKEIFGSIPFAPHQRKVSLM